MLVPGIEITEIPVTDHMTWAFATFRDDQGITATIELGRSRIDAEYDRILADMVKSLSGIEIPDDTAVENLLGLDTASLQADLPWPR
jgi:hypothetical protein